eukprot:4744793-Pyramimonas_sp.AAC.1
MEFWEFENHEVAYSWLRAFKIIPRNGVLRPRRCATVELKLLPRILRGTRPDPPRECAVR